MVGNCDQCAGDHLFPPGEDIDAGAYLIGRAFVGVGETCVAPCQAVPRVPMRPKADVLVAVFAAVRPQHSLTQERGRGYQL